MVGMNPDRTVRGFRSHTVRWCAGMLPPSPREEAAMRPTTIDHRRHERLLGVALLWLAAGGALLLSTVVPAHTVLLGWAPLVWLLLAPLALLLILEPGLPRQLFAWRHARREYASRRC
jgi:hypothetical protein